MERALRTQRRESPSGMAAVNSSTRQIGARLRKVRDPVELAIRAVEVLENTQIGRMPRLPYEHRARYGAVTPDEHPTDNGESIGQCCADRVAEVQKMNPPMELPYEFECSKCRTVYVLEMAILELFRA